MLGPRSEAADAIKPPMITLRQAEALATMY